MSRFSARAMALNNDWEQPAEAGWYTKRGVGGIIHEVGGWWFYPDVEPPKGQGPFRTMTRALRAAVDWEMAMERAAREAKR